MSKVDPDLLLELLENPSRHLPAGRELTPGPAQAQTPLRREPAAAMDREARSP
jgi:hypothetical protein